MTRLNKLFVLARVPGHRRDAVGALERLADGFSFSYKAGLREDFELVGFPREKGPVYRSPYLFATFSKRLPAPSRGDFSEMMSEWGVTEPDDQLAILAKSGGFQVGDSLELAEHRDPAADDLSSPLEFRVAGQKYHDDPDCCRAASGDQILFERERTLEEDPNAVRVKVAQRDDMTVGYVPRQYAAVFARVLDRGDSVIGSLVRSILVPREGRRWVIQASRARR